jgi:hypothetical protein
MSFPCNLCAKVFSTRGNLKRHTLNTHGNVQSKPVKISAGSAVLRQPFTCIVAGCTQSGKTVWVKTLLENAQKIISPPPQRIVWCYGQWQPSYFDMLRTTPRVEFNKGIPEDINKVDYLDISQRNLIVLDDFMAQSNKDKRIAHLFTKGSHH